MSIYTHIYIHITVSHIYSILYIGVCVCLNYSCKVCIYIYNM